MAQLNDRLKALRKSKDLTQEQVAAYLDISPQAVSRWECGATCPDIMLLPQLAALFSISVDALLGVDEGEKRREPVAVGGGQIISAGDFMRAARKSPALIFAGRRLLAAALPRLPPAIG